MLSVQQNPCPIRSHLLYVIRNPIGVDGYPRLLKEVRQAPIAAVATGTLNPAGADQAVAAEELMF